MKAIQFTDYFRARLKLRDVPLSMVEEVLLRSQERYFDRETRRNVALGRVKSGSEGRRWMAVVYEVEGNMLTAVTVHAVSRGQILRRVRNGRWVPQ